VSATPLTPSPRPGWRLFFHRARPHTLVAGGVVAIAVGVGLGALIGSAHLDASTAASKLVIGVLGGAVGFFATAAIWWRQERELRRLYAETAKAHDETTAALEGELRELVSRYESIAPAGPDARSKLHMTLALTFYEQARVEFEKASPANDEEVEPESPVG